VAAEKRLCLEVRDIVSHFQERPEEELDHAIWQIISRAIAPEGVVDLFAAAGLKKPDVSILSDEFLAEVRGMPQRSGRRWRRSCGSW